MHLNRKPYGTQAVPFLLGALRTSIFARHRRDIMTAAFSAIVGQSLGAIRWAFLALGVVLFGTQIALAQGPYPDNADAAIGATLFKNQCASCHNKNMKDNLTGPALGGVEGRWGEFPRQDLYAWIRGSQAMISQGHPRAKALWAEWQPNVMTNFPALTDAELESILLYINNQYTAEPVVSATSVAGGAVAKAAGTNWWLYGGLLAVLGVLSFVLARVISNLRYMQALSQGIPYQRKTLVQTLTSPALIAFLVFAAILLGGYTTVNKAINLGRQQGYQPTQPIKFSHALHSGINKIECQYCHDGARRSKHSVIPAANTCMNCHRAIKKGPLYGTAELTKIYASIGYDPKGDKYIENYDQMPEAEIEKLYKEWIGDNYAADNGGLLDEEGETVIEEQWEGIVAALTNEDHGDESIAGPIEWVRIHNLADHAYFNHAQHVAVGKLECQTCHGPIQEMEEVYQYSPLSMGWCINCHRQTPVQFEENAYYKSYEQYHNELKAGTRQAVTVEEIGGLECQKCHY